jgi:propane monooxygenase reductase subunit
VIIGGGAGLAPVLGLLRSMADRGIERRAVFYSGARQVRDLCFVDELAALATRLPGLRFVPVLSEAADGDGWDGETGLVTDVVARNEPELAGRDVYVCGPPPMVEAALALLADRGVKPAEIFYDKFTTTGDPGGEDDR